MTASFGARSYTSEGFRKQTPEKGEQVILVGLNRRPWLNGVQGHVVSQRADDDGCVVLRLPSASKPCTPVPRPEGQLPLDERPSPEYKKVRAHHLQRIRPQTSLSDLNKSWSTPEFRRSAVADSLRASGHLSPTSSPKSFGSGRSSPKSQSSGRSSNSDLCFELFPSSPGGRRPGLESIATVAFPTQLWESSLDSSLRRSLGNSMRNTLSSTFCTQRRTQQFHKGDPDIGSVGLLAYGSQNNPTGADIA